MEPILSDLAGNILWVAIKRGVLFFAMRLTRRLTRESHFKSTVLCLRHRIHARERYYEKAFSSGEDVLYVSIMSHDTIKEMKQYLAKARESRTRLRVLTWHPDTSEDTIEALRKHLHENDDPERTIQQVRQAAADWDTLKGKYANLDVRKYRSVPTMQAVIVGQQWALVELLPYATFKNDRPALILTPKTDPDAFLLFRNKFEKLWDDAE
jgi:hypothetical protein